MKVTEAEFKILEEAVKITGAGYEVKWTNSENLEGYIEPEELLSIIEDLIGAYEEKKNELKDFEEYVEDNYRHLSYKEQIGWSHNW